MASNNKSFYVERTGFSLRLARVGRGSDGDTIEEIREASPESQDEIRAFVQEFFQVKPGPGNFVRAHCGIYPTTRLLRTASLKDAPRPGEVSAWENIVTQQFRVNPSEYILKTLNPTDGLEFEGSRTQRDLLICGAPRDQLRMEQESLVDAGIYPLRMELGSVATIGLFLNAMRVQQISEPCLVLEIGEDSSHVLIMNGNRVESAGPLPLGLNAMIAGVRQELGLKDEGAAKKLFYSDSFDFREMGPRLIDRMVREIQSMIGFYEVQTGQSVTRMLCSLLPEKFSWLTEVFGSSLGMTPLQLDLRDFLARARIGVSSGLSPSALESRAGLLGLMVQAEVVQ